MRRHVYDARRDAIRDGLRGASRTTILAPRCARVVAARRLARGAALRDASSARSRALASLYIAFDASYRVSAISRANDSSALAFSRSCASHAVCSSHTTSVNRAILRDAAATSLESSFASPWTCIADRRRDGVEIARSRRRRSRVRDARRRVRVARPGRVNKLFVDCARHEPSRAPMSAERRRDTTTR